MPDSQEEEDANALGKMAYSVWVGSIIFVSFTTLTAICFLPNPIAVAVLLLLVSLKAGRLLTLRQSSQSTQAC